ncbi:ABC transporter ATP-binding protein [Leucobacter sp.]
MDRSEHEHRREPVGLELVGVQKRYGDVLAVRDVSLSVQPGEFLTLLGPSGSGKTTTLNMVAGFETPTAGRILLGTTDITRVPTHRRGLGMVFQSYALFPHMSVLENVMYPLKREGGAGSAKRKRALAALESVSLDHLAQRRPAQLSGGQQQRVALARAFVSNPPMLLMDEPLSALDKSLRTQMQEEIRRLHREIGTTVLFVTHDQEEALALSDRIVIMRDGDIAQVGTPTEIYESPNSSFTAKFLGAANFVDATVAAVEADGAVALSLGNGETASARATGDLAEGAPVRLVLRPEDGYVVEPGARDGNRVSAVFDEIVFLGDRLRCSGRFADGSPCLLWLSHREAAKVQPGRGVMLSWEPARSVVVPREA